jgi:hypothetical protein
MPRKTNVQLIRDFYKNVEVLLKFHRQIAGKKTQAITKGGYLGVYLFTFMCSFTSKLISKGVEFVEAKRGKKKELDAVAYFVATWAGHVMRRFGSSTQVRKQFDYDEGIKSFFKWIDNHFGPIDSKKRKPSPERAGLFFTIYDEARKDAKAFFKKDEKFKHLRGDIKKEIAGQGNDIIRLLADKIHMEYTRDPDEKEYAESLNQKFFKGLDKPYEDIQFEGADLDSLKITPLGS